MRNLFYNQLYTNAPHRRVTKVIKGNKEYNVLLQIVVKMKFKAAEFVHVHSTIL